MKRRPGRTKAGKPRPAPARAQRPSPRTRRVLGAILAALMVVAFTRIPIYRERLSSTWVQLANLPTRFRITADQLRLTRLPEFGGLDTVRKSSFEDAVIQISDVPADGNMASILFCAYYLYPRVLVQAKALEENPDLEPDFVLCTPHFCLPGTERTGLAVVSERARAYAAEHWNR